MTKKQREKFIKEIRLLCEDDTIPQEYLIKIIKAVVVSFASSKDYGLYPELLEAVGISYRNTLLKDWEATIIKASKMKPEDVMYSNV